MVWYNPGTWFKRPSKNTPNSSTTEPQYSEKITEQKPQTTGIIVTDFTTGESVRTDTTNNGQIIKRTYRGSSGGGSSTPAPIGQTEAFTQIEKNSPIASTGAILRDSGKLKPTTTTTTETTNMPTNVYYSENSNYVNPDPNSVTVYHKKGIVTGDSRAEIDIPLGFNLGAMYDYKGRTITGYTALAQSLKDYSVTNTITTTTWDVNKLEGGSKLVSFESPGGVTSMVVEPTDRIITNRYGEFKILEPGVNIPKGFTQINEKGEQLINGYTGSEALDYARSKSKIADVTLLTGSAFTYSNPLGLVSAYNLGSFALNKISGGRIGMSKESYITYSENIEKNTLRSVANSNMLTFAFKSPIVHLSALPLGGAIIGGVGKQAVIGALTVPSINTAVGPALVTGSGILLSNAGTIVQVGVPAITYALGKSIETKALNLKDLGVTDTTGAFVTSFAKTGLEFYAFGKGLQTGIEKGLPIVYRGVQVEGKTISQGFYFQYSGNPIYTKTATGFTPTGELSYTTGWGTPNSVVYPINRTGAYTPSGAVETQLYRQYLKTNYNQGISLENAYGVTSYTYGKPSTFYNKEYLNNFFKDSGFKTETSKALTKYFKGQSGYEIYGSSPTSAQVSGQVTRLKGYTGTGQVIYPNDPRLSKLPFSTTGGYRQVNDIDVVFNFERAGRNQVIKLEGYTGKGTIVNNIDNLPFTVPGGKAYEITNIINRYEGRTILKSNAGNFYLDKTKPVAVIQDTGQIMVNGVKKFDVHGIDTPAQFQAVAQPFGFSKLNPVSISGIKSSQLSQEGVNKLASVGSLQPSGIVGPDMIKRSKDIADFYVIQKQLIETSGGKGSVTSAIQLTAYKEQAVSYFGSKVFNNYPTLIASSSVSSSSSIGIGGFTPSIYTPSGSFSSSYKVGTSFNTVSTSSVSASVSPSSSISISPSSYKSFSRSPSYSYYRISPSSSPSPSPSPSPSSYILFPPFLRAGAWDDLGSNILKGGKRKTGYIPSFSALAFGEYGKYKPGKLSKSGLDYRPITGNWIKNTGVKLRK